MELKIKGNEGSGEKVKAGEVEKETKDQKARSAKKGVNAR